jgi:16S rRNA pseudouridine516 synthase
MRLDKLLSNLGYSSRSDVRSLIREGTVTHRDKGVKLSPSLDVAHEEICWLGEPLDPLPPRYLMLHKPLGYVCTRASSEGETIYDLLPPRYAHRNPEIVPVGRLDKDTSGLLFLTDDGSFVHTMTSPKRHIEKEYLVTLAHPLVGGEVELFASGTVMLYEEETPLLPAKLIVESPQVCRIIITEGRYHQVRRMFTHVGNEVVTLHRTRIGAYTLTDLESGSWCAFTPL